MKKLFVLLGVALVAIMAEAQTPCSIQVLGHRGGRYEIEENTMAGFKSACENGVRAFETDVRISKDGELVVMHDASLKRIADVDIKVEESTRKQLKKVVTKQGNSVLFVDELVDYFRDRGDIAYVEWEMKTRKYDESVLEEYCKKLYQMVMKNKPAVSLYVFSSFDERVLRQMKALYPEVECKLISSSPLSEELVAQAEALGVRRIACKIEKTSRHDMKKAHEKGFVINLWPGGSVEDFMLALSLGADIACTDCPVEVLRFIEKNLPWVTPAKSLK
ncbi:MAG: glycerophosphodiester phosphodiesterase [Alistipes sp.]|nr:glycerophosphodiester phosphodiesterase [Alistipes sp.]